MYLFENLKLFVTESNKIEGMGEPTRKELEAHTVFLESKATVRDLKIFVDSIAPNHTLRNKVGLDVRVGTYYPPRGGPEIETALEDLLKDTSLSPWKAHCVYESLHPFTDGNGRSGRVLWLWNMKHKQLMALRMGFLHLFYYQTLQERGSRE